MYLTHPQTAETWEISPAMHLSPRQFRKMQTRPYMVVQYAHYLAHTFTVDGQPPPLVWVDLQVALNGRSPQPLIDPTVNLAEITPSLQPAPWILPLNP